jgi:hypothetical protein
MTPPITFSLEKYVADWSRLRETVTVEGTLEEDGDYYIIDPDPTHPSSLLRVLKSNVPAYEQTRTARRTDSERHLYRISIRRGVPVQRIDFVKSDSLANGDRLDVNAPHLAPQPTPSRTYSAQSRDLITLVNAPHLAPQPTPSRTYSAQSKDLITLADAMQSGTVVALFNVGGESGDYRYLDGRPHLAAAGWPSVGMARGTVTPPFSGTRWKLISSPDSHHIRLQCLAYTEGPRYLYGDKEGVHPIRLAPSTVGTDYLGTWWSVVEERPYPQATYFTYSFLRIGVPNSACFLSAIATLDDVLFTDGSIPDCWHKWVLYRWSGDP